MKHSILLPFIIISSFLIFPFLLPNNDHQKALLNSASYKQDFQVIQPALPNEIKKFIKWMRENNERFDREKVTIYHVDINNDNKKEFVYVSIQGSGSYLTLAVFAQERDTYIPLPVPNEFGSTHEYKNPFTGTAEHFVLAQQKIYMLGVETAIGIGLTRDIYLWQQRKINAACDTFWLAQQRISLGARGRKHQNL